MPDGKMVIFCSKDGTKDAMTPAMLQKYCLDNGWKDAIMLDSGGSSQCITPEGTRKPTTEWKKGFYYIALKANLPILLYGLDYEHRKVRCTRTFMPTGNVERDMDEIKAYYKDMKGRHPEKFKI